MTWRLDSALIRNSKSPYTFYIPSKQVIDILNIGDQVKLLFLFNEDDCERMWVEISEINQNQYKGILQSEPLEIKDLHSGQEIIFKVEHISDTIYKDPEEYKWDYYFDSKVIVSNDVLDRREFNFLLRDHPNAESDTGWIASSGYEDDDYLNNSKNLLVVSLGVLLNIDDSILGILNDEPQCAYERSNKEEQFVRIQDYDWDSYNGK